MMYQTKWATTMLFAFLTFFAPSHLSAQCPNSYTANNVVLPSCGNSNNGYINLQYTTYYSNSTFIWSNGATSRAINNLSAGTYSVTATDPTGCTYTSSTYLPVSPTGLNVSANFSPCQRNIYAYTNWTAAQPVTYYWNNGATTSTIDNPAPGVWSVTATDASGCSGVKTVNIAPYGAPIAATNTSTPSVCNGSTGSIDLTVTGGLAPYTFYWYDGAAGQTVEDPVNVPAGPTRVYIYDSNGCGLWYTATVGGPHIDLQKLNMSCGAVNGSVTANVQGLTNPSYIWSNGGTTASITGLSAGTYGVTVNDGACTLTGSSTVTNGGMLTAYSFVDSTFDCTFNSMSGYAYGGAGSYQYLWSTGETDQTINYQAGTSIYYLTVTDGNGCSDIDTLDLGVAAQGGMVVSSVVQDATCGNSDGAIDLTVTGGWGNYEYLWSPTGATTEDISGIAAGFHIVTIREQGSQCAIHDTIPVGEFILFSSTDASCGLNNGSATVHDYGMTSPVYNWSTGGNTNTITNLSAGDYYVTVTNGACALIDTVTILDAGQMVAGVFSESTCQPDYIAGMPTNGAAPFTYLWDNGSSTQSINNPTPGNSYYVTITDANGCTDSASYVVPNPPPISATYAVTDATCNNKNGHIYLTMTGGTLPYNYNWSLGGGNTKNLHFIWPGQYSVNITDNNGCELNLNNMVVGGQTAINVTSSITYVNASNANGAIDITVNGVANPTFVWSNGATTEDISGLSSGYYTVSITDPLTGCVFDDDFNLPPPNVNNPNIKITGYVYDVSASGQCSPSGALPLQYQMVRLMPGGQIRFTNVHGRYTFNVNTPGNYTVEYINNSLGNVVVCPVGAIHAVNNTALGGCYSNNFYVTNPPFQDLNIDLWDYSNATPGFPYFTRVKYCNKGNTTVNNGTVEYDYNALLGFQSISGYGSTLTLHDILNHKFNWTFTNLLPNQCRYLDVKFTVPTSTALGTGLLGTADVFPQAGDATPGDNTDSEFTTVVGSWDPNDKQVEPYHDGDAWNGGIIYQTDEELEYTIRFQNTGSAPAHIVVIRDTLDVNLLPETVRDIDTKHDADVTIEDGNILVFTFDNIYLPDSTTDFDASMGFVKFTVNRVAGLPIGTEIENTAAIYFDYNAPVITNTPISIIDGGTAVVNVDANEFDVQAMPNPFEASVTLKYELDGNTNVSIRVLNSMGQVVYTHVVDQEQVAGAYIEYLNLNDLPSGMYLLNVETSKGNVTKKIVKR